MGQHSANLLRRRRPRPGAKEQKEEGGLTIRGEPHDLGRAVEQNGNLLDILGQRRRDTRAAKKFCRKWLTGLTDVPRGIVTAKLKSYGAAKHALLPKVEHRRHRSLNTRAKNAPRPTRQRERRMQRFKSPGQARHFLSASGPIARYCRPRRHRFSAPAYRRELRKRLPRWRGLTRLAQAD